MKKYFHKLIKRMGNKEQPELTINIPKKQPGYEENVEEITTEVTNV